MTKVQILLQGLASTPADIQRIIRPMTIADAIWEPGITPRSPSDVIGDKVRYEQAYRIQLMQVLQDNQPRLEIIPTTRFAHYSNSSLSQLGLQFAESRDATLTLLNELGPQQWQRIAFHENGGRTTLRYLIQALVEHDIEQTSLLVELVQTWHASRNQTQG